MNLNRVANIFNSSNLTSIKKEDLIDSTKKNDPVVKTVLNIFDTNLDGKIDSSELDLIEKMANFDGNNKEVSITDLKMLGALTGSVSDISFGDLSTLKSGKYSTKDNSLDTFDSYNNKNSSTTINNDGSVSTTSYAYDKTQTTTEYTSDYKMKSKTVVHKDNSQEQYKYDNGVLVQKDETLADKSKTTTLYNSDGKVLSVIKKDANNTFISQEEYDYDDYGKKASVVTSDANGKVTGQILYNSDNSRIEAKYDANGEIIQRDTFNNLSKPLTSFVKNADGSTVSTNYSYETNGDIKITAETLNSAGQKQSEQITTKHKNGNMESYTNGVLMAKDEVNSDRTITSTVYSAKDVISTVSKKDAKGNVIDTDYYSYNDGRLDNVVKKDSKGAVIGTGLYYYDDANQLESLDHFDAAGKLVDKTTWNPDGSKKVYKYNINNNIESVASTENYDKNNKLTRSVSREADGSIKTSSYTYDVPASGDTTINTDVKKGTAITSSTTIIHPDKSSQVDTYNSDKTQVVERKTTDKYGNAITTQYDNNLITSVAKANKLGNVTSKDEYSYTDGILSSVKHINGSGKLTGTTEYDKDGNTKDYNATGKIVSSKTTDPTTGAVTTEAYQYTSSYKIIKSQTKLGGKVQSAKFQTIRPDNSGETSIYGSNYNLLQKDQISADGKVKTTLYDNTNSNRILSVTNKDASGNILLTNKYTYGITGTIENIDCYDADNNLTQKIEYLFDGGKIITNYDADGSVKNTITYDKDDNVISAE